MNPKIDYQWKSSSPNKQLIIQIINVREVSIVARCAAEATLVVVIPLTLNMAMESIMPSDSQMIVQLFYI